MVTATNTDAYNTAKNLYLGWLDASINANERVARVARVWLDESLGAQQDVSNLLKRAVEDAQGAIAAEGETPTPLTFISRAGDIARANYALWTEAGLKAQERITRVVQTAFEEMRAVQTEFTQRAAR